MCFILVHSLGAAALSRLSRESAGKFRIILSLSANRTSPAMKFVVKLFPEITIKSKPVRRRFVSQLHENLRLVLREVDPAVDIRRGWDKLEVVSPGDAALGARLVEAMGRVSGISSISGGGMRKVTPCWR